MRGAVLVVASLFAAPAWSQAGAAEHVAVSFELIDRCGALEIEEIGLDAIEAACPELAQALTSSGARAFLSEAERAQLTLDELYELVESQQRYVRAAPRAPNTSALTPFLDSLDDPKRIEQPKTWWDRLKQWWRDWIARQGGEEDSWLARWLNGVDTPENLGKVVFTTFVVLTALIALGVLINEARAAGWWRRRRQAVLSSASAPLVERLEAGHDAPADQVSLVLRELVSLLIGAGRLPAERSLTHRELVQRARLDDAAQRSSFERLALTAERIVYDAVSPEPSETAEAVVRGRELHRALLGAKP